MSTLGFKGNLEYEALRNGIEAIGESQASVAFTVVADLGNGRVRLTANGHAKKKNQCFNIVGGGYAGTYRILNVPDANHVDIAATFGSTASGNMVFKSYLNGFGFFVRKVPLTISSLVAEDPSINTAQIIAETADFVVGDKVYLPFTSIAVTAGDIDVVRSPIRAALTYTNR